MITRLCCSPSEAWGWVEDLTADALRGDRHSLRCLVPALEHYLATIRAEGPHS